MEEEQKQNPATISKFKSRETIASSTKVCEQWPYYIWRCGIHPFHSPITLPSLQPPPPKLVLNMGIFFFRKASDLLIIGHWSGYWWHSHFKGSMGKIISKSRSKNNFSLLTGLLELVPRSCYKQFVYDENKDKEITFQ